MYYFLLLLTVISLVECSHVYHTGLQELLRSSSEHVYNTTHSLYVYDHLVQPEKYESNLMLNESYFELRSSMYIYPDEYTVVITFVSNNSFEYDSRCNTTIILDTIPTICLHPEYISDFNYAKNRISPIIENIANSYPGYTIIIAGENNGGIVGMLLTIFMHFSVDIKIEYLYLFNMHSYELHSLEPYLFRSVRYGYHIITHDNIPKIPSVVNIIV